MAEGTNSIFSLFNVLRGTFWHMYNAFFMSLPVSSFVFHSALMITKSVDLVVAHDGFPCVTESLIISIFIDNRGAF